MTITPLGQLMLDLDEIEKRNRKDYPEISAEIRRAIVRFDPDMSDPNLVRSLKTAHGPN